MLIPMQTHPMERPASRRSDPDCSAVEIESLNALDLGLLHRRWRALMGGPRRRQIMELVLAGHPSKNIAADLGIGQRTVENHRASIMKKTGTKSLPALARLALAAAWNGADEL
jgi:DNA-binding CsgD family transcriptional regulator